jgi:hypothetical protein
MLSSDKLLKNDLAGEIDSIVKSSPFMIEYPIVGKVIVE